MGKKTTSTQTVSVEWIQTIADILDSVLKVVLEHNSDILDLKLRLGALELDSELAEQAPKKPTRKPKKGS